MSSCCSSSSVDVKTPARQTAPCPSCGACANPVGRVTLMHQVMAPLNQQLPPEGFFFCASASCSAVYFSASGTVIEAHQLRGEIGLKSTKADRPLCYCFDISHARVIAEIEQTGGSPSKAFVVTQTRLKNCACDLRNPSGKCCLKAFPHER